MNVHKNAPLTPKGREAMARSVVEGGLSQADAAYQFNTTPKTVAKWVKRFRAEGVEGLHDRSSRPHSSPSQTPPPHARPSRRCAVSATPASRSPPRSGCRRPPSAASCAAGIKPVRDLEPAEPVRRYERAARRNDPHRHQKTRSFRQNRPPHHRRSDRSEQGRGAGWEFVHVCIDDHSRVAFSEIKPDEKADSAVPFLKAAVAYYKSLGVTVTRVMTDNGSCYQAFAFRDACKDLGIKHIRTKPYTPKPTARPSVSSRPRSVNGPTPKPIPHPTVAPTSFRSGYTDTTGIGLTAV